MTDTESLRFVADELIGKVRSVSADGRTLKRASRDFGRIVQQTPGLVVTPGSSQEIQETFKVARRAGIPVTLQGAGGSNNGQSLSNGGILVRGVPPTSAHFGHQKDGLVEVSASERWRTVEARLNRDGQRIPVLADYLDLSVGGTLSVGGYGADSIRSGPQVDQVVRVRLIKPDGDAVWCSPDENPDLFGYSLAGLGQIGALDRVVLRTERHKRYTTLFNYDHPSLEHLVESFEWLDGRADGPELFKGLYSRGRAVSTYGTTSSSFIEARQQPPPAPFSFRPRRWILPRYRRARSLAVGLWVGRFGTQARLWSDYLFDYRGLVEFMRFVSTRIDRGSFVDCLQSIYFIGVRNQARSTPLPLEATGSINAKVCFGVGLYSMIPLKDSEKLGRLRALNRELLERCVELGGRPYLYGWHELDDSVLRRVYGEGYTNLLELKHQLDPNGLFQPAKFGERAGLSLTGTQ